MSAQEGILLRITHLGTIPQELHLHDIVDGPHDPYYRRAGAVYVDPFQVIILDYTTAVALSFEDGVIRGLLDRGWITAEFFFGPAFTSALSIVGPPGDIPPTSFAANNNQTVPADITGFAFDNAQTRSFDALVSVSIIAATPAYAVYRLQGIRKATVWEVSATFTGDATGFVFSITNSGQIQYTSANTPTWVRTDVRFRAITLGV